MKPHRVLSLATLYPNAHTPRFGTFVARSLEALARRGDWDVTVINPIGLPPVLFGPYRALAAAAVDGFEHGVMVHRPRFTLIPKLGGPLNPALIARAVLPLARRLHAESPFDLVDAEFFYPDGPAARLIARALGLPWSVKARGADIQFWGHQRFVRGQILKAGREASGLLAVSEALADDMAALGLPREAITVHYTGLDRERFHPRDKATARAEIAARGLLPLAAGQPLLVTLGALIPRKGQEFVIRALPQVPGAALALVGTGPDEARLRALAAQSGVAGSVHFLGSLDHEAIPQLLSASNAMVLPSASEGLANAWVEALACGTPLVITDSGGARELVPDDSAGRIVPRDPTAIARAVKALLADPPSPEAAARIAARFSWDSHAALLADHLARIARTRPV